MPLMEANLKTLCAQVLNTNQKRHILFGIASGLSALHRLEIAHCDIKLENVLIDDKYQPRVADFGLAGSKRGAGTASYMAPEHWIETIPFDPFKSDAWSFGVLCYRLLENRFCFNNQQLKGLRDGSLHEPAIEYTVSPKPV